MHSSNALSKKRSGKNLILEWFLSFNCFPHCFVVCFFIWCIVFPEINAHPEISARQNQWFFKGGSTQNRWLLMGFGIFFITSENWAPGAFISANTAHLSGFFWNIARLRKSITFFLRCLCFIAQLFSKLQTFLPCFDRFFYSASHISVLYSLSTEFLWTRAILLGTRSLLCCLVLPLLCFFFINFALSTRMSQSERLFIFCTRGHPRMTSARG